MLLSATHDFTADVVIDAMGLGPKNGSRWTRRWLSTRLAVLVE